MDSLFFDVFRDLPFPHNAVDFGRLNKGLSKNPPSHVGISLDVASDKRRYLIASWKGFLSKTRVPRAIVEEVASAIPLIKSGKGTLLLSASKARVSSTVQIVGSHIVWEEASYWPIAFSTVLNQFSQLVSVHRQLIEIRRTEAARALEAQGHSADSIDTQSEFPRLLPTRQHYAFASLGAWLGGAVNLQYFAYYATIRQIHHCHLNRNYLGHIGFGEEAIRDIDESGLIAVPATLLATLIEAQGSFHLFGSLPIDEVNAVNLPAVSIDEHSRYAHENTLSGIVVDKYYRAPFWARKPERWGLYGADNVLRDHYEDFYAKLEITQLLRCKHYCIPVIEVSSVEEIRQYIAKIPVRDEFGIFFRGQTTLHTLQRADGVKQLLFADSCAVEPSLTTSAARNLAYVYDDLHYILRQFAEQQIYASDRGVIAKRAERWRSVASSPMCELDYAIMALAQHYGLPSHGLDVTTSLDVAVWFATNAYWKDTSSNAAGYRKLAASSWHDDVQRWPIVFACQAVTNTIRPSLRDCEELEEFGLLAKRPARQSAKFFHGGHSDHQNRLAETVVCAFRLRPNFYETESTFESLFPSPDDDPAYQFMLKFAEKYPEPWGSHVNRFHSLPG
ncbi:FRG domain protein [Paraburkholderia unamae]|uniref:FRG domain-containing protein n=1 Tax=Paraburkholderia unamae TaxID=219649 RepID=UPI001CAF7D9E|nr:FRG domain-containing protein [Paraburkholderia unamae]CAG9268341.1 FRG domain protein [Paraburkholderia unamae]